MIDAKEHQQVWSISTVIKTTGLGVSVNEQLAEKVHKPVIKKNLKEGKSMRKVRTLFGQHIQLKQDHCLKRIKV